MRTKELVVFDFDHTILDCNSDTYINVLAPSGSVPQEILSSYQKDKNWTGLMQRVFVYLHANGVREVDYQRCLSTMPFVSSMKSLLCNLTTGNGNKDFEVIIISDSNTFFIEYTLKYNQVDHVIREVITNKSHFDSDGCLRLEACHHQDWCQLSSQNMCKGHLMTEYINKRATEEMHFDRINYVGDGSNDLCPSLRLTNTDRVFPRVGFRLEKLAAERVQSKELSAQVYPFTCGEDIWKVLIE